VKRFLDSLKALGVARLLGIVVVGLGVLGAVGFVALRGSTQPMALLYGDLELRDSAQVAATLDKLHVPYEIRGGGAQIMVPSDQVDRLRLSMAREGVPAGGSVGYEVFDRGDSMTSNQFQQQMNQLRALEGELGRTIRTIRNVRNARVHLVLAKREPFAREQQEAQASIVLSMAGAQRMGDDEVQAIVNLVSTAVPGLKAQNISVVDNRGNLLARSGRAAGRDGKPNSNDDIRRAMEQRLGQAVEDMLSRTLGPGHVRAEAAVEMDFDRVNEMQEKFDPDGQVVRSQNSTTDASKNTEAQPGVSVANNLPNPDAQAGSASGSTTNRQEEHTTFEIGKTVRTLVRDSPQVRKLSMAVLVDGTTVRSEDGKPVWRELSQPDLDRIAMLVRSAIGYDEKRGDRVDVVNMRFNTPDDIGDAPATGGAWMQFDKADLIWLATLGIVALVVLFALGFVFRPLALKLATNLQLMPPSPAAAGALAAGMPALINGGDPSANPLLFAGPADAGDKDTMLNVANIQGEVRASSIRKLGELVDTQPDATVTVIRGWLSQTVG
jgi:flagellar M-ring protein FliF